ncbi:MAG: helix-turn-helix domain-containing protein [Phycisphaerae bacterium]
MDTLRRTIERDPRPAAVIAALAGVDRSILTRFLRGERDIVFSTAARLCTALGLELRPAKGKR